MAMMAEVTHTTSKAMEVEDRDKSKVRVTCEIFRHVHVMIYYQNVIGNRQQQIKLNWL